ncbi:MAG: HAMP domain-containing histidine kinase [Prevotellaceae bacterium]|nr:HAMP domain-containing histidine kinase [Prevotellaceae bacterium]
MKLSLKSIAGMAIGALLVILVYQTYWLTGLYTTMQRDVTQDINDAMRTGDYYELMLRVERMRTTGTVHGEITVSAGYDLNDNTAYIKNQTITNDGDVRKDSDTIAASGTRHHSTTTVSMRKDSGTVAAPQSQPPAMLTTNQGLDLLLSRQHNMQMFAAYVQRGLHSALDVMSEPDVAMYDSLLMSLLAERQLTMPYRLEYLHRWMAADSISHTDTLATYGTAGYVPGKHAERHQYDFDIHGQYAYRLTFEPLTLHVLGQMSSILITSLVILIIIGITFALLIRIIMQQKSLDEMKSDFTNNITHELKTPIAVAYAANDALLNFNLAANKPQRDSYLRICQEQLQRLSGLVEQILSMSMEQRKTFRLHLETLSLREILPPLIEQHKLKAGKPVETTLTVSPADLSVTADRTHFDNILSNLIDNAIKYSPERADIGITCLRATDGTVSISIADHGIGIPADKLPHIFEKFYRVPTGNVHNVKGYGLGLYYVKTMAEQHGWSVGVKSEGGKGSEFSLTL